MGTTLLNAWNWAEAEFSGVDLGDSRRQKRLVKVATRLAQNPQGALHGALSNWAELKAAYRLLEREEVTYEAVSQSHKEQTCRDCAEAGEYLLVEDTTELDFASHYATEGLGRIGNDSHQGLLLHSTLALRVERWNADTQPEVTVLGLFGQKCWARQEEVHHGHETRRQRLQRPRESQRWAAVFKQTGGPPLGSRWAYIADRESDIYEVFETCRERRTDWIVRANRRRALAEADGSVFDAVAQAAPLGSFRLDLRARPGQKRRTARLEVRAVPVRFQGPWRPGGHCEPMDMNIVEVREVDAPAAVEPLHWVLLTSWPIDDLSAVLRVVNAYTRRWLIEEYHKALKTGAGVEESQLTSARSIGALIGILAVVAVRLLNMKLLAAARPNDALETDKLGPEALTILEKKVGTPKEGWTNQSAIVAVARLGGFLARKSDGNPGWISIWRGWHRLMLMVQGFLLARGT